MATSVWKGHLTFGLVSIPVKLYRAARAEKVGFRQVHEASGTRVRQALYREPEVEPDPQDDPDQQPTRLSVQIGSKVVSFPVAHPVEVRREELAKGYEYEPGRYLVLNRAEIDHITPATAHEMQILEFVKLAEVDPIYFETSYYVAPDRAGERAYSLLFEALRASGFVGIAQVAMHRREHVVVIRPARTGIVLHTMFYETEIRREDEYRLSSQVADKELKLALLLVNNLVVAFDASKYRDGYREKLDALIKSKLEAQIPAAAEQRRPAPVVNILDALRRSLEPNQNTPASEETAIPETSKPKRARAKQRSAQAAESSAGSQA